MKPNQYFRAGSGSVIYNDQGEIFVFERADSPGTWQLQQGGMDAGESSEQTLWRELEEETALKPTDFDKVTLYPTWLYYNYGEELRPRLKDPNCLGQMHRWFFLKLKPGVNIDLSAAAHPEFTNVKTTTFEEFVVNNDQLKGVVIKQLFEFYKSL